MAKDKWYKEGLKFTCTQCGNCCGGPPGYVWVTKKEIVTIAEYLDEPESVLSDVQLRRIGFRQSLTEKPNGDCIFLKREKGQVFCGIYEVRPMQCRTWPFWSDNLTSHSAWDSASRTCPGMDEGKFHNFVSIEELRKKRAM